MATGTPFAIVDAFTTDHAFSGNPAGVVLLDEFPDARWLQGVANELHQAETAFLTPGKPGEFRLRWFTPVAEVALCGHAMLASAHRLWETGVLDEDAAATFATRSGRLTAVRDGDRVVLDFPAVPASQVTPSSQLQAALAGAVPVWVGVTDDPDAGERNLLAVLDSEEAVRTLVPDLQEVTRLPVGGLIVTAKRRDGGVVSRYFAPAYGIPEDPVTGSAHCTIAPYWREELGATLSAEQASPRGGELTVTSTDAGESTSQEGSHRSDGVPALNGTNAARCCSAPGPRPFQLVVLAGHAAHVRSGAGRRGGRGGRCRHPLRSEMP